MRAFGIKRAGAVVLAGAALGFLVGVPGGLWGCGRCCLAATRGRAA